METNVENYDSALVAAENNRIHKEKFYESLERLGIERVENDLLNPEKKKRKTFTFIKAEEYNALLLTIELAKNKSGTKTKSEYNILRDYDVIVLGDTKKIIKKRENENDNIRFLVPYEHLFDTIYRIHEHSHHTGIKCTPYKAVFGIDTPLGLSSTTIPVEEWSKLETAKQLFDAVGFAYSEEELGDDNEEHDGPEDVFDPKEYQLDELTQVTPIVQPSEIGPEIDRAAKNLLGIRETVRGNQAKQAETMRTRSKKYLPDVNIGDYVLLPIPDVDKGLTEAPNLICRVIDIDFKFQLYELACEAGVFTDMFARNCFDLLKDSNLTLNVNTSKSVKGIRAAVNELSVGGGQGMVKCNCTSACSTNRCSCRKSNLLCNSRCHGSNPACKNK